MERESKQVREKKAQSLRVGDLKMCLTSGRISPEQFAKKVGLSHMTIRRWLKKKNSELLPPKYLSILGPHLAAAHGPDLKMSSLVRDLEYMSMDAFMKKIEIYGRNFFDGRGNSGPSRDLNVLRSSVKEALKNAPGDQTLARCCSQLVKITKSPKLKLSTRAIAAGALRYFVDAFGTEGYAPTIDDLMGKLIVLSVALNVAHERSVSS